MSPSKKRVSEKAAKKSISSNGTSSVINSTTKKSAELSTVKKASEPTMGEQAQALVKAHPVISAGALVGAGLLAGAAASRALMHKPTVGEVMLDALKTSSRRASKQIAKVASNGLKSATASARRAMR